jgi:transcriptional regulator with XRE-family HTH domain
VKAQEKKEKISDPIVSRLRYYRVSQGLTWDQIAKKLGLSRGMLMMVLRQDRRLSPKALYRLEQIEREAASRKSSAQRIVDALIGEEDVVPQILGEERKRGASVELVVEYESVKPSQSLPSKVSLSPPEETDCRKLRTLFAETLDTRLVALACLPKPLRSDGFLDQLTAESRTRVTSAALSLVIPDWRSLVTGEM